MKKILSILMVMLFIVSMMLPFAAGDDSFTPSVEKKEAPELVEKEYTDPNTGSSIRYIADIIADDDGVETDLSRVPVIEAWVTPYAQKDAANETIRTNLEVAYEEVKNAKNFTELNPDLKRIIQEVNPNADIDNLVAYELFDLTISDDYMDILLDSETNFVRFTLDAGLRPDEPTPIVMHRSETSNKWLVVDPADVKNNGDGTLTVDFYELCPVMLIRISEKSVEEPTCKLWLLLLLLLLLILIIIVICVICSRKKEKKSSGKAEEETKNAEENAGNPATEEKTEPDQQN